MQSVQMEKPPEMLHLRKDKWAWDTFRRKKALNVISLNSFGTFKFISISR